MKAEVLYDLINKKTEEYIETLSQGIEFQVKRSIDKQVEEVVRHILVNKQYDISTTVKTKAQEAISDLNITFDDSDLKFIVSSIKSNLKEDIIESQRTKLREKIHFITEAYDNNVLTVGKARATLEAILNGSTEKTVK